MTTLYYVTAVLPYYQTRLVNVAFTRAYEDRQEQLISVVEAFTDSLNLNTDHWQGELNLLLDADEADFLAAFMRGEGNKVQVIEVQFPMASTDWSLNANGAWHDEIKHIESETWFVGWFDETSAFERDIS
jgi:hypothetical protein